MWCSKRKTRQVSLWFIVACVPFRSPAVSQRATQASGFDPEARLSLSGISPSETPDIVPMFMITSPSSVSLSIYLRQLTHSSPSINRLAIWNESRKFMNEIHERIHRIPTHNTSTCSPLLWNSPSISIRHLSKTCVARSPLLPWQLPAFIPMGRH